MRYLPGGGAGVRDAAGVEQEDVSPERGRAAGRAIKNDFGVGGIDMSCVTIPYSDFVEGQRAIAVLETIKAMLAGTNYCCDEIRLALGVPMPSEKGAASAGEY